MVAITDPAHADLALMCTMDGILGSALVDQSGNFADGTIYGAAVEAGIVGNCLAYDGNDYVDFGTDTRAGLAFIHNTLAFHIATWARTTRQNDGIVQSLIANTASSGEKGFWIGLEDRSNVANRALRFTIWSGGSAQDFSVPNVIPEDGAFHLYEAFGDGENITIAVDGNDVGTYQASPVTGDATRNLNFGRYNYSNPGGYVYGAQDISRIYTRPLTAAERLEILEEPWPYEIRGLVTVDGAPLTTEVRIYSVASGELLYTLNTDANGEYQRVLSTADQIYAMAVEPNGYRPLVHGPIDPALRNA